MTNPVQIGDATLYLGDCLEIMPTLEPVSGVVTDPPYGIKQDKGFEGFEGFGGFGAPIARKQYEGEWDNTRPSLKAFEAIIAAADNSIIFGGNYFTDLLPVGGHWLVWDKKNTMPTFSDCELAWTNIKRKSVKLLTYEYNGLLGKREPRVHPTQKPVEVMQWCIQRLPKESESILDPYMGSGSTGVACAKLGRKFIGIELDERYFNIACERIQKAYDQPDLFVAQPSEKPKQETMDV